MNENYPDLEMLAPLKQIMRFMETRDPRTLSEVFARENLVLLDSFSPYVFQGPGAAENWANGFISHAKNLVNLRHTFGKVQEFSRDGERIFFSQPVTWEGETYNKSFHETGGMAVMLLQQDDRWRVQNYGWAVTSFDLR